MSTLEELTAQLEQTREEFHRLVDEIVASGAWNAKSPEAGWNNGQLLTHVANGANRIPNTAKRLRQGKGMSPPGPLMALVNILNHWDTRYRARGATPASVKALYDQGHQYALETASGMNDDDWELSAPVFGEERSVLNSFQYITEHLREHADSMRRV